MSPFQDNPDIAKDPDNNNNFDYTIPDVSGPTNLHCPFYSHARKCNARNLSPYVDKSLIERGAIMRAAIPFGEEVSLEHFPSEVRLLLTSS
jgi:deferrochelatase/peroxidase EfeB